MAPSKSSHNAPGRVTRSRAKEEEKQKQRIVEIERAKREREIRETALRKEEARRTEARKVENKPFIKELKQSAKESQAQIDELVEKLDGQTKLVVQKEIEMDQEQKWIEKMQWRGGKTLLSLPVEIIER